MVAVKCNNIEDDIKKNIYKSTKLSLFCIDLSTIVGALGPFTEYDNAMTTNMHTNTDFMNELFTIYTNISHCHILYRPYVIQNKSSLMQKRRNYVIYVYVLLNIIFVLTIDSPKWRSVMYKIVGP